MIALLLFALFAPIMKMARGNPLWRRIGLSVIFVALIIALFSSEDCRVVLSLIYAYLTSLQCIYIVQIPATKANSWAKHGQKKSRPISRKNSLQA